MKKLFIFLLVTICHIPLFSQVGFGTWGNCSSQNITDYNPVVASNGAPGNVFGNVVSISGNYAIVGATRMAYIFFFNGTVWVEQAILTPSDPLQNNENFGASVCINGDYAIVGAIRAVGTIANQGKAYIYHFNGTAWVEQAILTANDGALDDFFGGSVSISGNYAIVGASYKNGYQGKAYIYNFDGTNWIQQAAFTASDPTNGFNYFGRDVSISGNYAMVGAWGKTVGRSAGQGKVYVYYLSRDIVIGGGNSLSWKQAQIITASDGKSQDYFGYSISLDGDNAIIGAYGKKVGNNARQGKAYIYRNNGRGGIRGGGWVQQDMLTAKDGAANNDFGKAVSISGNYAIVGCSPANPINNPQGGSAYIYQNIGGLWREYQKVTEPGGASFSGSGNFAGINNNKFILGATSVGNNRGMVFFGRIIP